MNNRMLVTALGLVVLAGAMVEASGQEPATASTSASKAPRPKGSASKAKRKVAVAKPEGRIPARESSREILESSASLASGTSTASDGPETTDATKPSEVGAGDESRSPADSQKPKIEMATFGAGCFWHVEAEFEWLPGVKSAISGYSGGTLANPTYDDVHEGWTGHAEVVQVEYDPAVISYEKLLRVFWSGHDPTQLNRQGPDFGTQYRSVIFYHTPEQKAAALKSYQDLTRARVFRAPIVTQLVPMQAFYAAEEYHQNYYGGKDGRRPSIRKPKRAAKTTPGKSAAKLNNAKLGNGQNARQKAAAGDPGNVKSPRAASDSGALSRRENE